MWKKIRRSLNSRSIINMIRICFDRHCFSIYRGKHHSKLVAVVKINNTPAKNVFRLGGDDPVMFFINKNANEFFCVDTIGMNGRKTRIYDVSYSSPWADFIMATDYPVTLKTKYLGHLNAFCDRAKYKTFTTRSEWRTIFQMTLPER